MISPLHFFTNIASCTTVIVLRTDFLSYLRGKTLRSKQEHDGFTLEQVYSLSKAQFHTCHILDPKGHRRILLHFLIKRRGLLTKTDPLSSANSNRKCFSQKLGFKFLSLENMGLRCDMVNSYFILKYLQYSGGQWPKS